MMEMYDESSADHRALPKVAGPLPWQLFAVCVIEMGERFVYIGISGPLQNYIQNPYPYDDNGTPGGLGRGQSTGAALGDFFKFWAYLCTVFGAIVADQWLGKFKTIIASVPIYVAGMVILVATSTPQALTASPDASAGMGGLIAFIITVGLGTGGLKACIAPMCGEQSTMRASYVRTDRKTGQRVVVDAGLTQNRTFMLYYWAANLGSLASLATTSIEKVHSFWMAYLLPLLVFIVVFVIFLGFSSKLIKSKPSGSPIVDAARTLSIAVKEHGFDRAMPSSLATRDKLQDYAFARTEIYTDTYVADIRSGIGACKYFVLFPVYFVVWVQSFSNLVAQAGSMDTGSTPNDLMQSIETIFMLGFIPILDLLVYPALRKYLNITLNPILRIFLGFIAAALGMAYACVLQYFIYQSPSDSSGIYVWIQAPAYVFLALSEIWVVITGLEVAYLKAPEMLRAFVSSMFWVMVALGAALGIALSPVSKDPHMVWLYGSLSVAAFLAGCVFYIWFRDSIANGPTVAAGADKAAADAALQGVQVVEKDEESLHVKK